MNNRTTKSLHIRPLGILAFILFVIGIYLYPLLLYTLVEKFARDASLLQYFLTIGSSFILGGAAIWAMHRDDFSLARVGLSLRSALQAFTLLTALWCLYGLLLALLGGESLFESTPDLSLLLQQWLFVGIAEELLFRGYLLERIRWFLKGAPRWVAMLSAALFSSAIFATWHIPARLFLGYRGGQMWGSLIQLFITGLVFAYLYLRTKNILFAGLFHGSWNVPVFGTQGDYMLMILAVVVVELYFLLKKVRTRT